MPPTLPGGREGLSLFVRHQQSAQPFEAVRGDPAHGDKLCDGIFDARRKQAAPPDDLTEEECSRALQRFQDLVRVGRELCR